MKQIRILAALALLLSAAACDATGADPERGALLFRYSGDVSGAFEASGRYRSAAAWESYAVGGSYTGSHLVVEARRGGGETDRFVLGGGPTQPGTYAIGARAEFQGVLMLGEIGRALPRASYELTSGTVVVEEVTEDRIRGRFSATAAERQDPARTVAITDGWFDVPNALEPRIVD